MLKTGVAELFIDHTICIGLHTFPRPFEVRKDHVTSFGQQMGVQGHGTLARYVAVRLSLLLLW